MGGQRPLEVLELRAALGREFLAGEGSGRGGGGRVRKSEDPLLEMGIGAVEPATQVERDWRATRVALNVCSVLVCLFVAAELWLVPEYSTGLLYGTAFLR